MSKEKDAAKGASEAEAGTSSRRNFLKLATAGAAASAAAAGTAAAQGRRNQAAACEPEGAQPSIPADITQRNTAPLPTIEFPMTGANLFGRACLAEGVAAMFCCPGNYNIINAVATHGIPSYGGRHEGAMTSAADGFIRASGEVALCSGTEGPGFTNMVSGLAAAHVARTPLLMVCSNLRMADEDTEAGIQLLYQQPLTEGIKKYGKRLVNPDRLAEYLGYTFRQLKTGIPGPVHIDFTAEVSNHRIKSEADLGYYGSKALYRTEVAPGAGHGRSDPGHGPDQRRPAADDRRLHRRLLQQGLGAASGLRRKGADPGHQSGPQLGRFPHDHPLAAGAAGGAYPSVDLVILVGQYCMPTPGEFAFGPDAKYIRIQPEAGDIGRNIPIDVGIVACEKLALEALADMARRTDRSAWINEVAAARKAFYDQNDEYYRIGAGYTDAVHPAVIAKQLGDFLYRGKLDKAQTTVVAGGYGIARYVRRYLEAHRPGQVINGAYQFGAIGPDVAYATGAAAAVQLGAGPRPPTRARRSSMSPATRASASPAWSWKPRPSTACRSSTSSTTTTAGACGTPIATCPRPLHMYLFQENVRYDKMAEALGGHGEYVTTPDQFLPALERAYDIARTQGIPSVINCQAKKEYWLRNEYAPGFLGKTEPGITAYYH